MESLSSHLGPTPVLFLLPAVTPLASRFRLRRLLIQMPLLEPRIPPSDRQQVLSSVKWVQHVDTCGSDFDDRKFHSRS